MMNCVRVLKLQQGDQFDQKALICINGHWTSKVTASAEVSRPQTGSMPGGAGLLQCPVHRVYQLEGSCTHHICKGISPITRSHDNPFRIETTPVSIGRM